MTNPFSFEEYADNWSYWDQNHRMQYPELSGVDGDVAFGVVTANGEFDDRWPIFDGATEWDQGRPPGCNGLAIGGWNNSQPGGGLYEVMTSADETARNKLLQTIISACEKYGYTRVVIDYENYQNPAPNPELYTSFLKKLGSALHDRGLCLEIAISPNPYNQQYYNLSALVESNAVDVFQVMLYDFAMGAYPVTVKSNNGILESQAYLEALTKIVPQDRISVGFPLYGLSFDLPSNISIEDIANGLKNNTLVADGYTYVVDGTGLTPDDMLESMIGNWDAPNAPWTVLDDGQSPPNYFYYNQTTHKIIAAFPPKAMASFADMIKTHFPGIHKAFAWEAQHDFDGHMMAEMMRDFNQEPGVYGTALLWSLQQPESLLAQTGLNFIKTITDVEQRSMVSKLWLETMGKDIWEQSTLTEQTRFRELLIQK